MCDLTNVQDRASGIKNIKNAKEWEKRSSVFLQFNGSCAVPFPPRYLVQRAIYTSGYTFQLSGIRLKFWARNEGRGKGGNRGCGDKKVGSFESVRFDSIRFDSAVKTESMRGRNCSETETTVDETRSFEKCD